MSYLHIFPFLFKNCAVDAIYMKLIFTCFFEFVNGCGYLFFERHGTINIINMSGGSSYEERK